MNLVYAFTRVGKGVCVLGALRNVDADYQLLRGISRKDGFPPDAFFDMNNDFGIKLQDVLKNSKNLLVISESMRDFFVREGLKDNEILPVAIRDPKGRPVKNPYFILHQVVLQDCIDLGRTVADRNPINPDIFIDVEQIFIEEDRIDPEVSIFRPRYHPLMLIVRRDLAERISAAGFTGIGFGEIEQYDQFETL